MTDELEQKGDTTPWVGPLMGRLTISVEEAGHLLGLGRSAAYAAVRRGDLPSRRLGRRVVIPVPALNRWLEAVTPLDDTAMYTNPRYAQWNDRSARPHRVNAQQWVDPKNHPLQHQDRERGDEP